MLSDLGGPVVGPMLANEVGGIVDGAAIEVSDHLLPRSSCMKG